MPSYLFNVNERDWDVASNQNHHRPAAHVHSWNSVGTHESYSAVRSFSNPADSLRSCTRGLNSSGRRESEEACSPLLRGCTRQHLTPASVAALSTAAGVEATTDGMETWSLILSLRRDSSHQQRKSYTGRKTRAGSVSINCVGKLTPWRVLLQALEASRVFQASDSQCSHIRK